MKQTTRNNIADVGYKVGINLASAVVIAMIIQGAFMETINVDNKLTAAAISALVIAFSMCYAGFVINEHGEDEQ